MCSSAIVALSAGAFLASFVVRRARRKPRQDEEGLEGYLFVEEEREDP